MSTMDGSEEIEHDANIKFLHRKICSKRIFIGPWDIKSASFSSVYEQEEHLQQSNEDSEHNDSLYSIEVDSSLKLLHDQNSLDNSQNSTTAMHNNPSCKSNTDKLLKETSLKSSSPPFNPPLATPSSEGTSFFTARSGANSTIYHSADSTPHFLLQAMNDNDEEEEIDYGFLNSDNAIFNTSTKPISPPEGDVDSNDSEVASVQTVRPLKPSNTNKDKLPSVQLPQTSQSTVLPLTPPSPTIQSVSKSQRKRNRHVSRKKKPLLWRRTGPASVSQQIPTIVTSDRLVFNPTGEIIKREPILCMRSVAGSSGTEPSRYKAAKEARYDLLTEKWRQVELVLTDSYISTYSSSNIYWPKQKLEHRIYLIGSHKPKKLQLYLLSPLDYSFCLRYQTQHSSRIPMMATMTFKARSFLKCQEWYMQIYDMLPNECKHPSPQWCKVYIPLLDLSVNLPLSNVKNSKKLTMEDVKETVISVLEEDRDELLKRLITNNDMVRMIEEDKSPSIHDLALCWTHEDRAEWIYWTHSSSDPERRIDTVICPQNIENTHRLELRLIEHTPHDIILRENVRLKEPLSVEGFMIHVTDFKGSLNAVLNAGRRLNYFASFDQYLFYIPSSKVDPPNTACFIDEDLLPRNIRSKPYVSALSPYTASCTEEIEEGEIQRRMRLMMEAKGIIDLTEVSYVRRAFSNELDELEESDISSRVLSKRPSRTPMLSHRHHSKPKRSQSIFPVKKERHKPCLELVMENGLQIKFEVYSSETCDLWVNYLARIIVYWKARKEAEKDAHSHANLFINTDNDTKKRTSKEKVVERSVKEKIADTRIWSYCLYEQCRDIVVSSKKKTS
ncbi:MAG: hypothetical protein EXX96DRAFT_224545 [Benjaminiella poitrasii]|nr:MAG: hypothetical protein EXX96DRAFT_224545 [Benjaminiella poitrasii]